ncbi:MAG: hypothetical protein AAFQ43_14360 [Bacteroidota bacterium]
MSVFRSLVLVRPGWLVAALPLAPEVPVALLDARDASVEALYAAGPEASGAE